MTDKEVMQMALDIIKKSRSGYGDDYHSEKEIKVIKALQAALAQPELEPVAYLCENAVGHKYFRWKKPQSIFKPIPLYTTPPQREWVGLTDADLIELIAFTHMSIEDARSVEAKLKEKNGY